MKIGDYTITADAYNWIVCHGSHRNYFPTLTAACGRVMANEAAKAIDGSPSDVIAAIVAATALIRESVQGITKEQVQ